MHRKKSTLQKITDNERQIRVTKNELGNSTSALIKSSEDIWITNNELNENFFEKHEQKRFNSYENQMITVYEHIVDNDKRYVREPLITAERKKTLPEWDLYKISQPFYLTRYSPINGLDLDFANLSYYTLKSAPQNNANKIIYDVTPRAQYLRDFEITNKDNAKENLFAEGHLVVNSLTGELINFKFIDVTYVSKKSEFNITIKEISNENLQEFPEIAAPERYIFR